MEKPRGRKTFFEGRYFKQTNGKFTISFIPAYFYGEKKNRTVIQVIEDNKSYQFEFEIDDIVVNRKPLSICIKDNIFTEDFLQVDLKNKTARIKAKIFYKKNDIKRLNVMGPFKYIPFLECRHDLISSFCEVNGIVEINDEKYVFRNGYGYIEADAGRSFPKEYLWTQYNCKTDGGIFGIMISIAYVPCFVTFLGCICVVNYKDKIFKFTTYNGAKVLCFTPNKVIVKQGSVVIIAEKLSDTNQKLLAPEKGELNREIRESINCQVKYTVIEKRKIVLEVVAPNASFEYSKK